MFAPNFVRTMLLSSLVVGSTCAIAQKGPGAPKAPINSSPSSPAVAPTITQPIYASGNVLIEGGGAPSEAVPIERVCNGLSRRIGYTDSKGQFQLDLGATTSMQDSSENDTAGSLSAPNKRSGIQWRYEGCELRAVIAGFVSSTVTMHGIDDFGQVRVGTIMVKRLANVEGSTISTTSMSAPKDARQAYEKARKLRGENKLPEAEQDANKAVTIYPNYAVAWALLGEIYFLQSRLEDSEKAYLRAKSCDAQYVPAYFGLAMIASNQKRWQEAASFTQQTIRLNAYAYPVAYFYNAVANYNLKNFDAAEQSARKFQSVDMDHRHPDIALMIGEILSDKGDYSGAIQQYRNYLTAVPDAPNAEQVKMYLQKLEAMAAAPAK